MDPKKVSDVLSEKSIDKKMIKVVEFVRYKVGEGI